MIHSGGTWKHRQEGEGLAGCRVRRGCTREELEMKRMCFSTHHGTEVDVRQPKQPCMAGKFQEEGEPICCFAGSSLL